MNAKVVAHRATTTAGLPASSLQDSDGSRASGTECDHVISSMPFSALVRALDPPAADVVLAAAD